MSEDERYCPVEVVGVGADLSRQPLVVLRDDHRRQLPIGIGACEALAIQQRLHGAFEPPRPLTVDLMLNTWRRLGAELTELRLDDLMLETFFAKLVFVQHGQKIKLDCRPSDGIAIALAAGAPILVAESVLARAQFADDDDEANHADDEDDDNDDGDEPDGDDAFE